MRAEDTNVVVLPAVTVGADRLDTVELIKQLQKRIEELEQKVNALEGGKATNAVAGDAKAKQHIDELDQKVKVLEREKELEQEAQEAKAKEAPKISIGEDGFAFASAKGDFAMQLKGVMQMDSRTFFNEPGVVGNDSLLLRRVRPILQGTVFRDFDFLFVPDFAPSSGPTIFDAYVNYRYSPALQFQAGKFKAPVGLEQLRRTGTSCSTSGRWRPTSCPTAMSVLNCTATCSTGEPATPPAYSTAPPTGAIPATRISLTTGRSWAAFLPAVQEVVRGSPARVWLWRGRQL